MSTELWTSTCQVIDVYVSRRRDIAVARKFFTKVFGDHGRPAEVVTDLARALRHVIDELFPAAFHNTGQYANNRVECDQRATQGRLQPMRGLKTDRTASVITAVTPSCRTCAADITSSASMPATV